MLSLVTLSLFQALYGGCLSMMGDVLEDLFYTYIAPTSPS